MGSTKLMAYQSLQRQLVSVVMTFSLSMFLSSIAVFGHGYVVSPRSRNFVAFQDGKWYPLSDNLPEKENCPHCLNLGGIKARCGMTSDRNYDSPKNGRGGPCPIFIQDHYTEGQDVILDVILTAHHKGHFEYKACPITPGQVPTQACFDKYPLFFVEDLLYGAPIDSFFPYRAYIAPSNVPGAVYESSGVYGMKFSHKFRLPRGLRGELVLIQWHYLTANSCTYSGYDSYNFPNFWNIKNALSKCVLIPEDGSGLPEQFWNCAEVSISPSNDTSLTLSPSTMTRVTALPSEVPSQVPSKFPSVVSSEAPSAGTSMGPSHIPSDMPTVGPSEISFRISSEKPSMIPSKVPSSEPSEVYSAKPSEAPSNVPSETPPGVPSDVPSGEPSSSPILLCNNKSPEAMSVNIGYYQSWAMWRESPCQPFYGSDIDVSAMQYTHLVYSFATISDSMVLEPRAGQVADETMNYEAFNVQKLKHPYPKTLIAVGGVINNIPGQNCTRFSEVSSSVSNRKTFADSVVAFLRQYDFDGIDFNWFFPGDQTRCGTTDDKANYVLLVGAVRDAFNKVPEDFVMTMAVPSLHHLLKNGYDLSSLSKYLDWFNIMAYDMVKHWTPAVRSHTNMAIVHDAVNYFLSNEVSANKLVLGLAAFGRTFTLTDPSCDKLGCPYGGAIKGGCGESKGYMSLFYIDVIVKEGLFKRQEYNSVTKTMELVTNTNEFVSYDNVTTFEEKISYAREQCLRGYMWWAVDMFYESFTLDQILSPTGTTGINAPLTPPPTVVPTLLPAPLPSNHTGSFVANSRPRCGSSEIDAREHCRPKCTIDADCDSGLMCYETQFNYCDDPNFVPQKWLDPVENTEVFHRCGRSEVEARTFCQKPCSGTYECDVDNGEWCHAVFANFCGSNIAKM